MLRAHTLSPLDHAPGRHEVCAALRRNDASAPAADLELITSSTAFEALEEDWTALFAAAGKPAQVFQTFAWNRCWCRHYLTPGTGARLAIVTGRQHGRLVLVWPLVVERIAGLRQLAWMGDPVSQYGDILATPEAIASGMAEDAWRFAVQTTRPDVARLRKVRADADVAPMLARLGARVVAAEKAPYIRLDGAADFETCEARFSPKGRKNRRRHMRRLLQSHTAEFMTRAGDANAAALACRAVAMKRAALARKGLISRAVADARFDRFFGDLAGDPRQATGCKVTALVCDGNTEALQISLDCLGHRFLHVAVYEPRLEKLGVGALLLEHDLRQGFEQGLRTYDLLAPKHGYKMEFCAESVSVSDYAIGISRRGRLYAACWFGPRQTIKRTVERLPPSLRRLVALAMTRRRVAADTA